MINLIFKKLIVPKSNDTKEVEAVQLWKVSWLSRYDKWDVHGHPEMEAFTSEEEAEQFAESLRNAFKLIRHPGADKVKVTKAK